MKRFLRILLQVALAVSVVACGNDLNQDSTSDDSYGSDDTGSRSVEPVDTDTTEGDSSDTGAAEIVIQDTLPDGFVPANPGDTQNSVGGYDVVGPLNASVVQDEQAICGNVIRVVMRDFAASHEDFQNASGSSIASTVESTIGMDRKPVKAADNGTAAFEQWYTNVDGVNQPFAVDLWLEPVGDTYVFDTGCFFPLDAVGFEETFEACCDEQQHRFHFTTEMHSKFKYNGGEQFTFIGDDDVFVFINDQLVVDLGGIHSAEEGGVVLDERAAELGLEVGEVYNFDLFQAERKTCGSNFRIETTLDFTGCGIILDDDILID